MGDFTSELERITGLSQKEPNIQQNCKICRKKTLMNYASNDWDAASTSITGDFDHSRARYLIYHRDISLQTYC
jgi:hypothetical protein